VELGGVALPERRGGGSRPPGARPSQERLTAISPSSEDGIEQTLLRRNYVGSCALS
jgi:hypothetical protein